MGRRGPHSASISPSPPSPLLTPPSPPLAPPQPLSSPPAVPLARGRGPGVPGLLVPVPHPTPSVPSTSSWPTWAVSRLRMRVLRVPLEVLQVRQALLEVLQVLRTPLMFLQVLQAPLEVPQVLQVPQVSQAIPMVPQVPQATPMVHMVPKVPQVPHRPTPPSVISAPRVIQTQVAFPFPHHYQHQPHHHQQHILSIIIITMKVVVSNWLKAHPLPKALSRVCCIGPCWPEISPTNAPVARQLFILG